MSGLTPEAGKHVTCKHLMRDASQCIFCERDRLKGELSLAEEGLANAMHDIERLTATASAEATESTRLRLRCGALAILLYGPVPERTREHVQRELEACESAVTALRAELAALAEHPTGD